MRRKIELVKGDARRRLGRYQVRTRAVFSALRRVAARPMTLDEALAMEGARAIEEVPSDMPPRGLR